MAELRDSFDERVGEVYAYMDLLTSIEVSAQEGPPKFEGSGVPLTPQQQKLLYAGVYLQLYNLVEATMTLCVGAVAEAVAGTAWTPRDLSEPLRNEWVRATARTHVDLSYPNRLEAAIKTVEQVVEGHPVDCDFAIEKGGGGNWDDYSIEDMSGRLGCELDVSEAVRSSVKRPFRDEMGPLVLVRSRRNSLAHGSMSFTESAAEVTVSDLRDLVTAVLDYLGEVVGQFEHYVDHYEYLDPKSRPAGAAA